MLDDPDADPALALRSLRDVALANRLFGGRRAVLRAVDALLRDAPASQTELTLLDIGTGLGDIPAAAAIRATRAGHRLRTIGLELAPRLAQAASDRCTHAIAADAMTLPFGNHSIDIVTCSQVLHHFEGPAADRLLQECTRVARQRVIIGDLRRSWLAAAGLWTSSFLLGFHPVSRHDGVVSVMRGYTRDELRLLVAGATGIDPWVTHGLGFRVTASWSPR
jgi:ubiquinone/menaquinone biosynthesis C-methylase UbiE